VHSSTDRPGGRDVAPALRPDSRYRSHDHLDPGSRADHWRRHDVKIERDRFLSHESIEIAYDIRPMLSL
jgi:hypothetical protein